jgi:LysM repeat protein
MLRRILIIILVVVVIIAAIFAIRWFLNRDSGSEEATDEPAGIVDGADVDVTNTDVTIIEGNDAGETPVIEEGGVVDQLADAQQGTDGYPAVGDGSGEVVVTEGNVAPVEGETSQGGDATGADPNAGGGVPAGSGETAPALGDAVAIEPPAGGIGSVAAVSPAATFVQAGVAVTHTVTNNEWLTQLARCYGTTVADIQAANNYACPDLIHPGWVVNIANPGNAGPITINDAPCFQYHTVQQGETLYSIATQYGISYQWLARINAIYNYNTIYAGQQLVIPNPVDPVFTQIPPEPFFYSNCWYGNCPVYPAPVPVPYGQ